MLRRQLPAVVALTIFAAGCGERTFSPPLAPVGLEIDHPADTQSVDADSVEVSGRVSPATALVLVDGSEVAPEAGGAFHTTVALNPGVNVIDIEAGADRHPSAVTALRVTRELRVLIPVDLTDGSVDDAVERLTGLGLDPVTIDANTLLDALDVLASDGVCGTDPSEGTRVAPGSQVTVYVARHCS